jgi:hypothetical protein
MSIDVEIQDEQGLALARYDGPPLGLQFLKLATPKTACFRFIVPWGDTTFNEEQIEVLLSELREATTNTTNPTRLRELSKLIQFVEGATGVHVYLKFIGD